MLDTPGIEADERQVAEVLLGERLEHDAGKRLGVVGPARHVGIALAADFGMHVER